MRQLSIPWVLAVLVTSLVVGRSYGQTSTIRNVVASDWTQVACDADPSVCGVGQVCELKTPPGTKFCRCDANNLWHWDATLAKCVNNVGLGQKCGDTVSGNNPSAKCAVPGSTCMIPYALQNRKSCKCDPNKYVEVDNPDTDNVVDAAFTKICAKILPRSVKDDTNDCDKCNPEGSKCYALPTAITPLTFDETTSSGCYCDVSFSGDTCHSIHVEVMCKFSDKRMQVCYTPHNDVTIDPTKTDEVMFVTKHFDDAHCQGSQLTDATKIENFCAADSFLLDIKIPEPKETEESKLAEKELTCDTQVGSTGRQTDYRSYITYLGRDGQVMSLIAYCSHKTGVEVSTGGFSMQRSPTNNRGEMLLADISMKVIDILGTDLGLNPVIKVNDDIRVRIDLTVDDTYGGILPITCFLSPKQAADDSHAFGKTSYLHENSCPTETGSKKAMIFTRKNDQPNVVETDLMRFQPLKTGSSTYLHCLVMICLKGAEVNCMPKTLTECTSAPARRKRATADQPYDEETLDLKLTLLDDTDTKASVQDSSTITMSTLGFSIVIALMLALIIVAVAVVILLVFKLKSRGAKVDDNVELSTNKPQRFALPRVTRNNMRI